MRVLAVVSLAVLQACASLSGGAERAPIPQASAVDLDAFMGAWYVIAHIPPPGEGKAYNGVEHYRLAEDGRILTTYRFRKGGFDGPLKTYTPNAKVVPNTGNAEWGMQFIWPFRAEYIIAALDTVQGITIIGRNKRDYVWLMAREPELEDQQYQAWVQRIADMGYDLSALREHPQQWPEARPRPPREE
jgi:apolipoprotein D and lipocalin family protein